MSLLLTGGAGFIGSNVLAELNRQGVVDIDVVDNINCKEKQKNLQGKKFSSYTHKDEFNFVLKNDTTAVIHLGAQSSTTEQDFDYLQKNNVEFTKKLYKICKQNKIPFIYASSASVYGNGENGFDDDQPLNKFTPLNKYALSKWLVDDYIIKDGGFNGDFCCVGLRFFNVYGAGEEHKGSMKSMVNKAFFQQKATGRVNLFRSYLEGVLDGEQKRDFVYVKDVCKVILWILKNKQVSGIFNVGTGEAKTFLELAKTVFTVQNLQPDIKFVDMPDNIKNQYQYYTCAKVDKLRKAGYNEPFTSLGEGIKDYVCNYLLTDKF